MNVDHATLRKNMTISSMRSMLGQTANTLLSCMRRQIFKYQTVSTSESPLFLFLERRNCSPHKWTLNSVLWIKRGLPRYNEVLCQCGGRTLTQWHSRIDFDSQWDCFVISHDVKETPDVFPGIWVSSAWVTPVSCKAESSMRWPFRCSYYKQVCAVSLWTQVFRWMVGVWKASHTIRMDTQLYCSFPLLISSFSKPGFSLIFHKVTNFKLVKCIDRSLIATGTVNLCVNCLKWTPGVGGIIEENNWCCSFVWRRPASSMRSTWRRPKSQTPVFSEPLCSHQQNSHVFEDP
jgi:hypothetical protein